MTSGKISKGGTAGESSNEVNYLGFYHFLIVIVIISISISIIMMIMMIW